MKERSKRQLEICLSCILAPRTGTVKEPCKPKGTAKIDTTLWRAESLDGSPLESGQSVKVTDIEGLGLIVEAHSSDNSDPNDGDPTPKMAQCGPF